MLYIYIYTYKHDIAFPFFLPVQDWDLYGIDWDGPVSTDGDNTVTVPPFTAELTTPLVAETLQQQLERVAGDNIMRYLVVRDILISLST